MVDLSSEVVLFLWSVFYHWATLVGGVVATVITVIESLLEKRLSWRISKWAFLGTAFVTCFVAWQSEYHKAQRLGADKIRLEERLVAQTQIKAPNIELIGTIEWLEISEREGKYPVVAIRVRIDNKGMISSTIKKNDWHLEADIYGSFQPAKKIPDCRGADSRNCFIMIKSFEDGEKLVFPLYSSGIRSPIVKQCIYHSGDVLADKIDTNPLKSGDGQKGILLFEYKGKIDDIQISMIFNLGYKDINEKSYAIPYSRVLRLYDNRFQFPEDAASLECIDVNLLKQK